MHVVDRSECIAADEVSFPAASLVPDEPTVRLIARTLREAALQRDLAGFSRTIVAALEELFENAQVDCVFHDDDSDSFWREHEGRGIAASDSLCRQVVRSARSLTATVSLANPAITASSTAARLVAAPMLDSRGRAHAILTVARKMPEVHGPHDSARLDSLARTLAPLLEAFSMEAESAPSPEQPSTKADALFDPMALRAHREGELFGNAVELPPTVSPRVLIGAMVAVMSMGFATSLVPLSLHARGPAAVRLPNAVAVATSHAGGLERHLVAEGDRVVRDQPLARLNAGQAEAEVQNALRAFEDALAARIADPDDVTLERRAAERHAELRSNRHWLSRHTLRAPVAGVVLDLRSQPGAYLEEGETVARIASAGDREELIAVLPVRHLPRLEKGQSVRFRVDGFGRTDLEGTVTHVGAVAGNRELEARLSVGLARALRVPEPSVLVSASLSTTRFRHRGVEHRLRPGATGTIDVSLESGRALDVLIDAIRRIAKGE